MQILRHLGLAARFVSGYLIQLKRRREVAGRARGAPQDFTDLHAWAEVYLPGAGWIGLDPTSGLFAGEGHIPLAATPHTALRRRSPAASSLAEVEFAFRDARRPHARNAARHQAVHRRSWARSTRSASSRRRTAAHDVRLTIGGEPTFVSIDDIDGRSGTPPQSDRRNARSAAKLIRRLPRALRPAAAPLRAGQVVSG